MLIDLENVKYPHLEEDNDDIEWNISKKRSYSQHYEQEPFQMSYPERNGLFSFKHFHSKCFRFLTLFLTFETFILLCAPSNFLEFRSFSRPLFQAQKAPHQRSFLSSSSSGSFTNSPPTSNPILALVAECEPEVYRKYVSFISHFLLGFLSCLFDLDL